MDRVGDPERLRALRETGLLDSGPEEAFDRYTRLVRMALGVPVSLVSLVDAERQYFKSEQGLSGGSRASRQTPLSHSLCRHVVESGERLVVSDLRLHPVLCGTPPVEEYGFLSYAGIPLVTQDGLLLGTLCAIDRNAREWTDRDLAILTDLAAGVQTEILMRQEAATRSRAELLVEAERRVLEALSLRRPITEILDTLASAIDEQISGVRSSILLVDDGVLRIGAAPNLPDEFNVAVDGTRIGPEEGCCGTAVFRDEMVIVEDVSDDPLTAPWRDQTLAAGIRACWSVPLRSARGEVLGTFAMYADEPGRPDSHALTVVQRAAQIAAVAVQRSRMEQALVESEERLSRIVHRAPVGIVLSRIERGIFIEANDAFLGMLGYTRDEVIGRSALDLGIWAIPEERAQAAQFLASEGKAGRVMAHLRTKAGEIRHVEVSVDRVEVRGVWCALSMHRDVTESLRAEAALREREAHYRRLVTAAPVAIFAVDSSGCFTEMNDAGLAILDRTAESVVGQHFTRLLAEDEVTRGRDMFQRILAGELKNDVVETKIRRPSGDVRLLAMSVTAIPAGEGVSGLQGLARDITDERRQQQQLARAERLASVGTLIGGVAHELNNPLTGILGMIELLLAEPASSADRETIEVVRREAERMAKIVADLRQLAQQTQDSPRRRDAVDLNDVVRHVLRVRRYRLDTGNIKVTEDLADGIAPVLANRAEMEQVVLNLLVNAEHAVATATVREITIATRAGASHTRLTMRDTGGGIETAHLERIFDPFFTTKAPGEGTGLGLSLVYSIVTDHGGTVTVQNHGGGAEFVVDVPHAETRRAGAQAPQSPERATLPLRILVVDDEPAIRAMLARLMRRRGHEIDVAGDGAEALRILDALSTAQDGRADYDVILSDLRMPGLDGEQLMWRLQERGGYDDRVVFMTGDAASPEARRIIERTGVPVLLKPFSLQQVTDLLERVTRRNG